MRAFFVFRASSLVNTDYVVQFKLIRDSAVADTCHHRGHIGILFDEILGADRIIKSLADGDVAEFDAFACGIFEHSSVSNEKFVGISVRLPTLVTYGLLFLQSSSCKHTPS